MTIKTVLASAVIALGLAGGAQAATIWADSISVPGADGVATAGSRTDPDNALGAPDDEFYSLGLGGSADFGFGGATFDGSAATVYEVTWGNPAGHFERVEVFVGFDGDNNSFTSIGTIDNTDAQDGDTLTTNLSFDTIRLVDVTPSSSPSFDGFDVDAVGVQPVPLPAAVLMMLAALGGLWGVGRRKTV